MSKQIPLRAKNGAVRAHALVDDEDYEWAASRRWHLHSAGYAATSTQGRKFFMHRLVVARREGRELGDSELVHHKNERPLDNRRNELVLTDRAAHARHHHRGSGYVSCGSDSRVRPWKAYLPGKPTRVIGRYATKLEAEEALRGATEG